jgi:hypothetical protein
MQEERLRAVGKRLEFFIDTCYNDNMSAFASTCKMPVSTISGMKDGSNFTIKNLFALERGGVNPSWLVAKNSPNIPMFSSNKIGQSLKRKNPKASIPSYLTSAQKGRNNIYRAAEWIKIEYGSVASFVVTHAGKHYFTIGGVDIYFNEDIITRILDFKDIPPPDFYDMMEDAGCTRGYLDNNIENEDESSTITDQIEETLTPLIKKIIQESLPEIIEKLSTIK